jgi:serine/threonine-protein kinase
MPLALPRLSPADVTAALGADALFLGGGTFGDTWRVREHAYKILCGAPQEPQRLKREVEALSRVDNPNIVRLYGAAELEIGGVRYQVLDFEYIPGRDVQELIDAGEWPSPDDTFGFAHVLLSGLLALHESGTIHRDLKPANIALRNGKWCDPVILDLGLSKQIDASTFTVYPGLIGTPLYMAPEQLRGEQAAKAADLFAAGVILCTLMLHAHPFYVTGEAIDLPTLLERQRQYAPTFPKDFPNELRGVADRLTSYESFRRGSAKSSLRRLAGI